MCTPLTIIISVLTIIGVFYFLLGNLHPKYRSKLRSIQLVALCKNRYIKKYSLNAILAPIIQDLKKLVCFMYEFHVHIA